MNKCSTSLITGKCRWRSQWMCVTHIHTQSVGWIKSHDWKCSHHHIWPHIVTVDIPPTLTPLYREMHHLSQLTYSKYSSWFSCCFNTTQQNRPSSQPSRIMGQFSNKAANSCFHRSEWFTQWWGEAQQCPVMDQGSLSARASRELDPKEEKRKALVWGYSLRQPLTFFFNKSKWFGDCFVYYHVSNINKI
jgi:hypothetical protein